ncbi:MAG TPA: TonB-dependent receptor [Candidatus Marinimicrobia bacterium]|nr:TonB-dependent receptor [Candidatus Neomarinimicrobiota bacterium]
MRSKLAILTLVLFLVPALVFAQSGDIQGRVTDKVTGEGIAGANVMIEGTTLGAATDVDGNFVIDDVPAGNIRIIVSVIGYAKVDRTVTVASERTVKVNFQLEREALELGALEVLASRATRTTPVAYTNVEKIDIEINLGSRDMPMVLNTTPSVYATEQGGGAGDARVNVRGFNQRNVAVMINGVPVNDMENGWVYWSNWDGVADATSSIQLQRGLSAVNLAAPSIGGTMNILTDPAALKAGGRFKQEFGSGGFLKSTLSYASGLINDKFAVSGTVVRKTGEGVIDKAWTDAWAYYLGLSYQANKNNRFELFALGAPQRHGQMRYAQNIAAYDHKYAEDVFSDEVLAIDDDANGTPDVFDTFSEAGRTYNENWNTVSKDYKSKQYFYMYGDRNVDRHDPNFLNESENYFHKPQVNLNWYLTLTEKMRLSTVAYFSGGSGGGTGTYGDMMWDYSGPSRAVDWDATIAMNQSNETRKHAPKPVGESAGYLRNSYNRQWTIGAISKLNYDVSEKMKVQLGIDLRTAEINHGREVRDLLGGDYAVNGKLDYYAGTYSKFFNEFDHVYTDGSLDYDATYANAKDKKLGGFIDYNNTNTIDWLGFFGQAEYKTNLYSVYGMGGYSMIKYGLVDHFKKAVNHPAEYVTATDDGELEIIADWISAIQFKTGGLYKVTDNMEAFANFGYVEKVPILDNIIDDVEIALAPDPTNEKFISTELGLNFRALAGKFATKMNLYDTRWLDRNLVRAVTTGQGSSGDTDLIFLTGLNQHHQGFELEVAYQPMRLFRLDGAFSYGNWKYTDDATGTYKDIENDTTYQYSYAVKDLMVGDMPQTIYSITGSLLPIKGLVIAATLNYYDRFYANWDPASREIGAGGTADRDQNWQVPAYGKVDLHAKYDIPVNFGNVGFQAYLHVFNALDAIYVQDAVDNSQYNAFTADGKNHAADDAEVYIGMPRRINFGLNINF